MATEKSIKTGSTLITRGNKPLVRVSYADVKNYLCPLATDAEIGLFLKICESEGLNPFTGECYLIKYQQGDKAAIVIAIESFLKVAENHPQYQGHEAGIIIKQKDKPPEFREGTFILEDYDGTLVGGWAKVYRKDRDKPFYSAVNINEYRKFKRDGGPTRFWNDMPATMIKKVALSHSMREAFPNRFGGTYTDAEFEVVAEGEVPPAYTVNGYPDWPKFWARQKEKFPEGTNIEDKIHELLRVGSIKDDWIGKGMTLEEAEVVINEKLRVMHQPEVVEAEGVVVEEEEAPPTEESPKSETNGRRNPDTVKEEEVKTPNDLYRVCFECWELQPAEVRKQLGYSTQFDYLSSGEKPWMAFLKIKAARH